MLATPNRSITLSRPPLPWKQEARDEQSLRIRHQFQTTQSRPSWGSKRLLSSGQAAVYRRYPFTIILKTAVETPVDPLRVKIDPGSKTTGIAIVNDATAEVVFAAELSHQGEAIKKRLEKRRGVRRSRRNRHTRYRQARWRNRRNKKKGWLPPSLQSRITNILTWVKRFMRKCHITALSMESVRFDTQLMEHAEISGVEYQQGTLAGYELRDYMLEKWKRACAYCGKQNIPLQIEHIVPKAKYHDNRVSNLCIACEKCNQRKGTKDIKELSQEETRPLKEDPRASKSATQGCCCCECDEMGTFPKIRSARLADRMWFWRSHQVQPDQQKAPPRPIGWMRLVWAKAHRKWFRLVGCIHCSSLPMGMVEEECVALTRTVLPMAIPSKLDARRASKQETLSKL